MAVFATSSCFDLADALGGTNLDAKSCPVCCTAIFYDWTGYDDEEGNLAVPAEPIDRSKCTETAQGAPA